MLKQTFFIPSTFISARHCMGDAKSIKVRNRKDLMTSKQHEQGDTELHFQGQEDLVRERPGQRTKLQ